MKTAPNPLENVSEERIVLGQLLQSESAFWSVADVLKPEHFSKEIHGRIFAAIRDILMDGKKMSLTLVQARVGEEYADGLSTMTLMTALLRDADNGDLEGVETIVDLWKRRTHIAELRRAMKATEAAETHIADLISEHETRLQDITLNGQSIPLRTIGQAAAQVMDFSVKSRKSGVLPGFDTGLPSLDEILGRIHATDLGVIGAARGDGKTLVATQLADRFQQIAPVCLFELEMRDLDLAARALAGQTTLSVSQIEAGDFDQFSLDELVLARDRLLKSRFYIDDRPKLTVEQIRERCKVLKRSKGLGVAIIDHFRLIRSSQRTKDKFERMEYVSGELKAMAKDLEIAVIVLSQVTRMSQRRDSNPEPQLNDLDGGGALEQDADWAIGAFRRDRWLKAQRPYDLDSKEGRDWSEKMVKHRGRIEITALKRRRGADGEKREFHFDGRAGRISEVER